MSGQTELTRDLTCFGNVIMFLNSVSLERIFEHIFSYRVKVCSTDRAQQYLLRSGINPADGVKFYYCACYGHYGTGSQSVVCTIHYWECPLTTKNTIHLYASSYEGY